MGSGSATEMAALISAATGLSLGHRTYYMTMHRQHLQRAATFFLPVKRRAQATSRCGSGNSAAKALNDVIGGEVWEASFLLSAFVLLNPSLFSPGQRVLELGTGVGLPSLLLLELRRRRKRREGEDIQAPGELTLTDNDSVVLESLHISAVEEGGVEDSCKEKKGEDGDVALSVRYFDWLEPANIDPSLHDLVIGSALVYSPEHAVALSNTVSHLLLSPTSTVRGIIVIQIGDRPGFERLQRLLSSVSGVSFTAHAVSEEVYDLAQQSMVHTSAVSSSDVSFFRHKNVTFRPRALEGAGVHKVISTPRESFTILTITKD